MTKQPRWVQKATKSTLRIGTPNRFQPIYKPILWHRTALRKVPLKTLFFLFCPGQEWTFKALHSPRSIRFKAARLGGRFKRTDRWNLAIIGKETCYKTMKCSLRNMDREVGVGDTEDRTGYPKQGTLSSSQFLHCLCMKWEWEQCLLQEVRVGAEMRSLLKWSTLGAAQGFTGFSPSCRITVNVVSGLLNTDLQHHTPSAVAPWSRVRVFLAMTSPDSRIFYVVHHALEPCNFLAFIFKYYER